MPIERHCGVVTRDVRLNDLDPVLAELDYPIARPAAAARLDDVTLVYADGRENLSRVFDRIDDDTFEDADDLRSSLFSALPTEAVGEPGQSEGDG